MDAIICIKTPNSTDEILIENINKIVAVNNITDIHPIEFTATTESLKISLGNTYSFVGSNKTLSVNGSEIIYVILRK